jgi:hypothetical protein
MSTEDDNDQSVPTAGEAPPPPRHRPPGPGLGETFLWIIGFLAVQVGFFAAVEVVLKVWSGGQPDKLVAQWGPNGQIYVIVLPLLLTLLILLPAGLWRLRPSPLRCHDRLVAVLHDHSVADSTDFF